MAYGMARQPDGSRSPTVVYSSYLVDGHPVPAKPEAVQRLTAAGVRVVVVCAEGPSFTAGLDVTDAAMMSAIGGGGGGEQQQDAARVAFRARQHVLGQRVAPGIAKLHLMQPAAHAAAA